VSELSSYTQVLSRGPWSAALAPFQMHGRDCPPQNPVGTPPGPLASPAQPLSCRATVKPVLVLLPVLGLTWLVGVLVHLSPAWAYAAVGLNSLQVPPGPGPHMSSAGVAGWPGGWGGSVLSLMVVTKALGTLLGGGRTRGDWVKPPIKQQNLREDFVAR